MFLFFHFFLGRGVGAVLQHSAALVPDACGFAEQSGQYQAGTGRHRRRGSTVHQVPGSAAGFRRGPFQSGQCAAAAGKTAGRHSALQGSHQDFADLCRRLLQHGQYAERNDGHSRFAILRRWAVFVLLHCVKTLTSSYYYVGVKKYESIKTGGLYHQVIE